ncbi:[protein-PII] uridylyltransferase [Parafrankia colletiae]|uniref:Bifunctional uridylyltransferase/uridylyl-removing enzyme n=1 Tax=Parafrankia colletiae TaxID=573497 RepID=A0A1S1R065_9ACTN|nr:[protein-PII] uridylyltransferase [Parafrankia colletiae]MCK9899162.1 [protein-PII] uridylyltransferase [Frankia sp. Cpl3]OHV38712.1 [protein-PII] uridylyltransferase [Parafrankia colletiae]
MDARLQALRGRADAFPGVTGPALRAGLTDLADAALAELVGEPGPGTALLAVGGYGRREPAFGSDLDLVLLHDGRRRDISALADAIWYPLWDAGVGLDHSVRTVDEAVSVADSDLKAAMGLLDARLVRGDASLAEKLVERVRSRWRARAPRRLPELAASVAERARRNGEVAFLLEPDLKDSRGGMRDVHALHALAAAWVAEEPPERVREAYRVLLDVRGEVRRLGQGRGQDRLLLQDGETIAAALGYPDSVALSRAVAEAGRAISWTWDTTWYRVASAQRSKIGVRLRRPVRRPLDEGVVEQDGEIQLARDADPASDPGLVLRAAAAAARTGIPFGRYAIDRLGQEAPEMPAPWPEAARDDLVSLLATGDAAIGVLESLDQVGLLVRLIPEWAAVRSRPQRNPYHRYTVDRHLIEAAARAATHTRDVDRPDLLLLGALLHDIGKGYPGDHTDAGIVVVRELAPRLGLPPEDTEVLLAMIRHHLLLTEAATRRDIDDPVTIESVATAAGSVRVLTLLHRLTEADAQATGPTAWNAWKARLVSDLVHRATAVLDGREPPCPPALSERQAALLALPADLTVQVNPLPDDAMFEIVVVTADDRVGLLATTAGVLALSRLDVRRASARSSGGRSLLQAAVAAPHGERPDQRRLQEDLRGALTGDFDVTARLAGREQDYAATRRRNTPGPPQVIFDDSGSVTVVEVRAPDRAGVLHRIARALAEVGLDVRTAIVATLGLDVVDAFYIEDPAATAGQPSGPEPAAGTGSITRTGQSASMLSIERRAEVSSAILAALTANEASVAS